MLPWLVLLGLLGDALQGCHASLTMRCSQAVVAAQAELLSTFACWSPSVSQLCSWLNNASHSAPSMRLRALVAAASAGMSNVSSARCSADRCPALTNLLVIIVGGIPIAMPTVLSVTLALGAFRLAKEGAIVARMSAVEEMAGGQPIQPGLDDMRWTVLLRDYMLSVEEMAGVPFSSHGDCSLQTTAELH